MTKILMAISEWGYWGEELVGPLEACDEAGYEVEFLTPTGGRPTPLSVSMSTDFVDPPQGKVVTAQTMADKTRDLDAGHRLDTPTNLAGWVPARPYPSSPTYLRDMEAHYRAVEQVVTHDLPAYDALVIVGGSGAMVDLA
ncbi:MAG: type 1 glutamine amidotransferase domain-containing protein, partial [Actinoplanes sp.]